MSLIQVLIFTLILITYRIFADHNYKEWFIFFSSLVIIFWFQPVTPIRNLYYWFPVFGIGVSVIAWLTITDHSNWLSKNNIYTIIFIIIFTLLIGLMKYLRLEILFKFSTSPKLVSILFFWSLIGIFILIIKNMNDLQKIRCILLFTLFFILAIIKTPILSIKASQLIRELNNQVGHLASPLDLQWIGFSYLSFRIIHVLRDHQLGKINNLNLRDFLNYLFFFPAFLAGPIDRIERFNRDIQNNLSTKNDDLVQGILRIIVGSGKKFIIADSLALIGITEYSVSRINNSFWMWILVFAYGLRIYFDFSGYTDIAIGLARIIGISLPENFNKPYQSRNLIIFWNNWHITLTQWFRTYYFNPINRYIKSKNIIVSQEPLIFIMQTSTMILIGLWHGITPNFIIWGFWNGIGLFLNNRWISLMKHFSRFSEDKPLIASTIKYSSILLTFLFVSLGWVWFALPSINSSLKVFEKLFGR